MGRQIVHSIGFVTLLLAITLGLNQRLVAAQQPPQWLPDEQVLDYLDDTFTPFLVADQNRTVHAFASQWVGDDYAQRAIIYRQWNLADGWTAPIDILLSPVGAAQIYGAFLDQAGMMHLAFWGGEPREANIYYAQAPAINAGQAPAWSAPIMVGEMPNLPPSGAIAGDDDGNLVIIYSGNIAGSGVYAINSTNAGDSWSEPKPIFLTYDPELTPFSLHLSVDDDNQLHAVWNVVNATGTDMAVYYTRLDSTDQTWDEPRLLEEKIDQEGFFGPSFPAIANAGESVIVMYNSGNPSTNDPVPAGRPVQRVARSGDNGQTWLEPTGPFPRHLGRSGEHALAVDSEGDVHAIFMQRIETSIEGKNVVLDGPWHSQFRNGRWSEPISFSTETAPHDMRAVVSQGNVLLVAWREDPGVGQSGVWFTYSLLDTPELPVVPLPTPSPTPTATPPPTATPEIPTPTPRPVQTNVEDEPAINVNNPAGPFILGLVPVIVVLVGFIIGHQVFFRRH